MIKYNILLVQNFTIFDYENKSIPENFDIKPLKLKFLGLLVPLIIKIVY